MSIKDVYIFHRKFANSMMWDGKKSLSQRILKEVCYGTHCIVDIQTIGCLLMYSYSGDTWHDFKIVQRLIIEQNNCTVLVHNIQESALSLKTYPDFRDLQ